MLCFILMMMGAGCAQSLNKDVQAAMKKYDELILRTDAAGIAAMFTPDGELAAPGRTSVRGRDSIQKFLQRYAHIKVLQQQSTTKSIEWHSDTAVQYGTYRQTSMMENKPVEVKGMFEARWVTQADGGLLLQKMSAWPVPQ